MTSIPQSRRSNLFMRLASRQDESFYDELRIPVGRRYVDMQPKGQVANCRMGNCSRRLFDGHAFVSVIGRFFVSLVGRRVGTSAVRRVAR